LATNLRIAVASVVRKTTIQEDSKDENVKYVEKIVSAYFGIRDLDFRSKKPEDRAAVRKYSIDVTHIVAEHYNGADSVLDLTALKPMHIKFGDPAPRQPKVLYIFYVPSKIDDIAMNPDPSVVRKLFGTKSNIKFLKSSRVLAKTEVKGADLTLKCYPYQDLQDSSAMDVLRGNALKDMDLNLHQTESHIITCASEEEAVKMKRRFDKYLLDLNPEIIAANLGAGKYMVDISPKMEEFIRLRRLTRLNRDNKDNAYFVRLLSPEKDPLPGKEKNVYMKYKNSSGINSAIFKDRHSITLVE